MIDAHAHLIDEHYSDVDAMIKSFSDDGLNLVISVGCDRESALKTVELAKKYDNVYAVIGFHPDYVDEYDESIFKYLDDPKVVGVGEIGLDYHTTKDNIEKQKSMFVRQLEIANEHGLPIEIHSRDAVGDTLEILKKHKDLLKNGGIWHCFNESVEIFKEARKLGLIVSFGGVTTFKNARNSTEIIKNAQLDEFVLETDCPYLTPEPFRGKVVNEPKYVRYVARHIADVKMTNIKNIVDATDKNVYNLFKKIGR